MRPHNSTATQPGATDSQAKGCLHAANLITVIRSLDPPTLNKVYGPEVKEDGTLQGHAVACVTAGMAQTLDISTASAMVTLLRQVTEGTADCIVAGSWQGATAGYQFGVITKTALTARAKSLPMVGAFHTNAKGFVTTARLKEYMQPGAWMLCDCDNPPGIPADWAKLDIKQRLEILEPLIPGISTCERVELRSGSSRLLNGTGPGPYSHAWIRVSDPAKIELLRAYVRVHMVLQDLSFPSPRYGKATGKVIGHEHRTVIDLAVWITGRIVFVSKPEVAPEVAGYTIAPADIHIVNEGAGVLDLSWVDLPAQDTLAEFKDKTGITLSYNHQDDGFLTESRGELTMDTEIERQGTVKTLRAWITGKKAPLHLRCEAPFRASVSEAAFIKIGPDGQPFVFDVGNTTKYILGIAPSKWATIMAAAQTAIPSPGTAKKARKKAAPTHQDRPGDAETASEVSGAPQTADNALQAVLAAPGALLADREEPEDKYTTTTLAQALGSVPRKILPRADSTKAGYTKIQPITTGNVEAALAYVGVLPRFSMMDCRVNYVLPERIDMARFGHDNNRQIELMTVNAICDVLNSTGMRNRKDIKSRITDIALGHPWHPMMDWVNWKPWDGTDRFASLLATITPTDEDDERMLRIYLRRWLIQTIECVFGWRIRPKRQKGLVLTLVGDQNLGKSHWLLALAPDYSLGGKHLNLNSGNARDNKHECLKAPIVELAELDTTFNRSDQGSTKAFITNDWDEYRLPYGEEWQERPRCTSFCASVNDKRFLRDSTGSRRYGAVGIDACDFNHGIDMQQVWAQAKTWWDAGEQHWLTPDEERLQTARNATFQQVDGVEEQVGVELAARQDTQKYPHLSHIGTATMTMLLGLKHTEPRTVSSVGDAMTKALGPETDRRNIGGNKRGWFVRLTAHEARELKVEIPHQDKAEEAYARHENNRAEVQRKTEAMRALRKK